MSRASSEGDESESYGRSERLRPPEPTFRDYTVERYNRTLARLEMYRWRYAAAVLSMTVLTGLLFTGYRPATTEFTAQLRWLTLVWILPIPLLLLTTFVFYVWMRSARFRLDGPAAPRPGVKPTVVFQVTTTGVNVTTVLNTVDSALYWTNRHPEVGFRPEIWALVEEWGYTPNRAVYDALRAKGVQVVVTPIAYRSARGTTRKGRALQFAVEERRRRGLDPARTWVYHQDDETAVGEDTILGIDDFLSRYGDEKALGCGIILYPQHGGDLRPQQLQEFNRSKDDFRTLFTITSRHNVFSGFHGSHYIVRADVEEETGWDVGPNMTSEDLIFENSVRRQHGAICHLLKGFAYEQAALNWRDQLTQRRRWFQGWWRAVLRQPFSPQRRFAMTYSMLVWMAAVVSFCAMVTSWSYGYSPLLPYSGALAGFVWATMISGYHQGYLLHLEYLPRRTVPLPRVILNGIIGSLLDAVAPWYGTFTPRPKTFQVISKDSRPAPMGGSTGGPIARRPVSAH